VSRKSLHQWLIGWAGLCVLLLTPAGIAFGLPLQLGRVALAVLLTPRTADTLSAILLLVFLAMALLCAGVGHLNARRGRGADANLWRAFAVCWLGFPAIGLISLFSLTLYWPH
jgi:hypothetical protein